MTMTMEEEEATAPAASSSSSNGSATQSMIVCSSTVVDYNNVTSSSTTSADAVVGASLFVRSTTATIAEAAVDNEITDSSNTFQPNTGDIRLAFSEVKGTLEDEVADGKWERYYLALA